ncbi:MAG: FtsX-like permease family protein [Pseudomonadota bacterium]
MSSQLGPIVRSLRRHKGPSILLLVEVAVGMAVLSHLFVMGEMYRGMAFSRSGLDEQNLIFVTRHFAGHRAPLDRARELALADQVALARIDGVTAAAAVDELPLPEIEAFPLVLRPVAGGLAGAADVGNANADADANAATAWPLRATADVVAALGLRGLEGVDLTSRDPLPSGVRRAVITRSLAERMFAPGGALGRDIDAEVMGRARVVGVVDDFRIRMPFLPDTKSVVVLADVPVSESRLIYVVRTQRGQRDRVSGLIAGVLGRVPGGSGDAVDVPTFDHHAMRFHIVARGATIVIAWTGLIVLGVALVGALALASFSVAERTRQIGVRRALGARRGHIVRYFLLENAVVTSVGLALGLLLTMMINLPVRRMSPIMAVGWGHIVTAMVIFWGAGLLSALVPARRAARIPPTAATRSL